MTRAPRRHPPLALSSGPAQPVPVTWAELPLSCPRPGDTLWSLHPRVYLPIHEAGIEQCPYCSTVYVLDMADPDDPLYPNIEIEREHARAVDPLGSTPQVTNTGSTHDDERQLGGI